MPLEVRGSLHLESPGASSLVLQSQGDRLQLRATSLSDLWRALSGLPRGSVRGRLLSHLDRALRGSALRVEVRLGDRLVASLGTESHPGLLSRLLRIAPAALYPAGVLAGLMPRRG